MTTGASCGRSPWSLAASIERLTLRIALRSAAGDGFSAVPHRGVHRQTSKSAEEWRSIPRLNEHVALRARTHTRP